MSFHAFEAARELYIRLSLHFAPKDEVISADTVY